MAGDAENMTDIHSEMVAIGNRALAASRKLALLSAQQKNRILRAMADELESRSGAIVSANEEDMTAARAAGLSDAMLDRLELDERRITGMANSLREVAQLKSS